MPVRNVYEVRQRTWDRSLDRSLGLFVDDMMAEQAITACYWQAWQAAMSQAFQPSVWLPDEARSEMIAQGWDLWWPDDKNGDKPLFYKVPMQLWDQLPSSITNFTFTLEDAWEPMVRVRV